MKKNLLYGIHSVLSRLTHAPQEITCLYVLQGQAHLKKQKVIQLANKNTLKICQVTRQTLDQMIGHANHQGIIAECKIISPQDKHDLANLLNNLSSPALLLILDQVQDPHNLGACLRTAAVAGAHAVIAPKDRSVGLTPTVYKVASGAVESVPFIQITNLARTLEYLKQQNIWVFGLAAEAASSLYSENLRIPLALVLGSEGTGLRQLTRKSCDKLLSIPMQGKLASLNVSVAAGISLFEAVRQRA